MENRLWVESLRAKNLLTLSGLAGSNLTTNLHQSALLPVGPASHTGIEIDTTTQHARKTDRKSLQDCKTILIANKV